MVKQTDLKSPESLWARHHAEWRDPAQIASQWDDAAAVDPLLLKYTVRGNLWEVLEATQITLLVTREYEHLVMALTVSEGKPQITYMKFPHPSGIAVDIPQKTVYLASTRNPNQIFDLTPLSGTLERGDLNTRGILPAHQRPLIPIRSRFFPGCLYMHDLALIEGELHANAVGQNAVVRLRPNGLSELVWYPRCIEQNGIPVLSQNHLQLNSIAAGKDLSTSFFSASADRISARRPGHKNFPVDKRGVIFSGATREPVVHGLTRPHSARLFEGQVWVDNSGYGELGIAQAGKFDPVARLPGWTRGLGFYDRFAFVGTSRVIPRFRQYAPGLDLERSRCGVHAVDTGTGQVVGSIYWNAGNQIFAVEAVPQSLTTGFLFRVGAQRATQYEKKLFYAFTVNHPSPKDQSS